MCAEYSTAVECVQENTLRGGVSTEATMMFRICRGMLQGEQGTGAHQRLFHQENTALACSRRQKVSSEAQIVVCCKLAALTVSGMYHVLV